MQIRRLVLVSLAALQALIGPGVVSITRAQGVPPGPPPDVTSTASPAVDVTPARLGYLTGEVSFWRPGATDWAPARVNTPLAPGDVLYTGNGGTVELQLDSRAFMRAAPGTHVSL